MFKAFFAVQTFQPDESEFEEKYPHEKNFAAYFQEHIRPLRDGLEQERLRLLKQFQFRTKIAAIIAAIGIFLAYFCIEQCTEQVQGFGFIILILAIIGVGYWVMLPLQHYSSAIKQQVFSKLIAFYGNFHYEPNGDLHFGALAPSGILPEYDRAKSEDLIVGQHKDVDIGIGEAHLEERHVTYDSKGRRRERYRTLFKGLIVQLAMNKNFAGRTIIVKDRGGLLNWFKGKFGELETVKLEDPVFEKLFEVYSTNQIEARYLLTTAFMDRLLRLSDLFRNVSSGKHFADKEKNALSKFYGGVRNFGAAASNKSMHCSFYDDKLLIMIPCEQDLFEPPPIHEPALQIKDIRRFLEEINLVFQIIDELKLNMKIGL